MTTQFNANAALFRPRGTTIYVSDLPETITEESLLAFIQEKTSVLP